MVNAGRIQTDTPKELAMANPDHTPAGDHPVQAPVHLLDLEVSADELLAKLPGSRRQTQSLAREGGVSVVMMAMEPGDAVQEHSTKGAVNVQLIRGHALLAAGNDSFELRPGKLVLIQPEVRHDLRAQEQSVVVLTISGGN